MKIRISVLVVCLFLFLNICNNSFAGVPQRATSWYNHKQTQPRLVGHHIQIRKFIPISTIEMFVKHPIVYSPMRRPRYSRFTNNLLLNNNIFTRNKFLSRYNGIRQDFSIASTRPVRFCPNCACGLPFQRDSSNSFEFPWLAALLNNNEYFCSATLINDRYVLTTAQCMIRLFRIGGTYNNDIALLRLDAPIIFDVTLTPVCLPPDFRSFEDFNGLVTAWNNLNLSAGTSPLMQQTDVRIIPNYECRRTGYGQGITENMICTRSLDSEDGACQSDNGGPLQVTNGTFYILVGIVSWGESCPELTFPEVYTRVNNYLSWIYKNTADACYC